MAEIKVLNGNDVLKTMYPKMNDNFANINNELTEEKSTRSTEADSLQSQIDEHKASTTAHKAENITYVGTINASNVKAALDVTDLRISNIIAQSGTSDTEVVDARTSTTKNKVFNVLKDRLEEAEIDLKNLNNPSYSEKLLNDAGIFSLGTGKTAAGVVTDVSSSVEEGAVSVTLKAGDNVQITPYDFDKIRRCNLSDSGQVLAYYGDTAFKEDGSNGQVMVEIPKFYYRTEKTDTGYNWYISKYPAYGFKLHPAFIRKGVEINNIYISAYEGSLYDTSALAYLLNDEQVADFTVSTGDKLSSIANVKPASGLTQNLTLPNSRILAHNRGTGWELQDFITVSAIEMLFIVEYGTLNSQSIFNGVTNITDDGVSNMAVKTGTTSSLGNGSGQVTVTHPQTGQTTTPFSYRGIENFYGNIWKWVDGLNIQADNKPYVADSNFVSDKFDGNYTYLGAVLPNANGYMSDVVVNGNIDYGFLPSQATGSSTTKFADYYYQSTGNCVALLGGAWRYGSVAGAFSWALSDSSSDRDRSIGARLLYIPQGGAN